MVIVVQLDVRKAFDHVDHRSAFKAMKVHGLAVFSMACCVDLGEQQHDGEMEKCGIKCCAHASRITEARIELERTELVWRAARLFTGSDMLLGRC